MVTTNFRVLSVKVLIAVAAFFVIGGSWVLGGLVATLEQASSFETIFSSVYVGFLVTFAAAILLISIIPMGARGLWINSIAGRFISAFVIGLCFYGFMYFAV